MVLLYFFFLYNIITVLPVDLYFGGFPPVSAGFIFISFSKSSTSLTGLLILNFFAYSKYAVVTSSCILASSNFLVISLF